MNLNVWRPRKQAKTRHPWSPVPRLEVHQANLTTRTSHNFEKPISNTTTLELNIIKCHLNVYCLSSPVSRGSINISSFAHIVEVSTKIRQICITPKTKANTVISNKSRSRCLWWYEAVSVTVSDHLYFCDGIINRKHPMRYYTNIYSLHGQPWILVGDNENPHSAQTAMPVL